MRAEQDEAANDAKASKEEALGLSAEHTSVRSEAEALYVRDVDSNVHGAESHADLEAAKGEVSLLLGEAELLSKSEATWAKVARLQAKLEAWQAELVRLQVASSQGSDAQALGPVFADSRPSIIAEYLRNEVH
ncbi:hypothetical protein ACLOJK_028439 [Asimina triloba]